MTILFPIIYSAALTYLVWKAFKVMSNGWSISGTEKKSFNSTNLQQKKYTIHPELLDKSGNITEEELLTVRFSNDNDSSLEGKSSTTD
tara:strand:+ start:931 stop:1194 length:264 start_codon:yes stop_codon:yes gene_type:complete